MRRAGWAGGRAEAGWWGTGRDKGRRVWRGQGRPGPPPCRLAPHALSCIPAACTTVFQPLLDTRKAARPARSKAAALLKSCRPDLLHAHYALPLAPVPPSVYELYGDFVMKNPFHEMDQVRPGHLAVGRPWNALRAVGLPVLPVLPLAAPAPAAPACPLDMLLPSTHALCPAVPQQEAARTYAQRESARRHCGLSAPAHAPAPLPAALPAPG